MNNYIALLEKINAFMSGLFSRRPGAFACVPGCADCCVGGIRVWRVERDNIERFVASSKVNTNGIAAATNSCRWLDANMHCSIYSARPVVCRLWGAPLLFTGETEHEDTVHLSSEAPIRNITSEDGLLSCCDKNFREGVHDELAHRDMVDTRIVLSTLAAINHVYCKGIGADPSERFPLESAIDSTAN